MRTKRVARTEALDLDKPMNQEQFGEMIGCPQQDVSKLIRFGILSPNGTFNEWFVQYDRFMKGQIFARKGWQGLALL
jgi:hypothetical protein